MLRNIIFISLLLIFDFSAFCRQQDVESREIIFVSDTQLPLSLEKMVHTHTKQSPIVTKALLKHITQQKARNIFMLGDVVGMGKKARMWSVIDTFLIAAKHNAQNVYAVPGNHEILLNPKKGMENFEKRFPNQSVRHVHVVDSIAVIMLNSNFKYLKPKGVTEQQIWYKNTLNACDTMSSVKAVIVCCHHSPFTNSLIVSENKQVLDNFVVPFCNSKKCSVFLSGHSHNFEHFEFKCKDFFVIGGGGGLRQPIAENLKAVDLAADYKPRFHYFSVLRKNNTLYLTSYYLDKNTNDFVKGYTFVVATL